ncbi:unnamed protein product [Ectocarpus sp. 6 AP-2014]
MEEKGVGMLLRWSYNLCRWSLCVSGFASTHTRAHPTLPCCCSGWSVHCTAVAMNLEGRRKCLDAFIVALNQTCDGRENRWYASTLELQLVSLKFCGACRRFPPWCRSTNAS